MELCLSPHLSPLHHLWLNSSAWQLFNWPNDNDWNLQSYGIRSLVFPYLKALPGHVQSKSLYPSLGERSLLGGSPNLNNNRKVSYHLPRNATLFNTAKSACQFLGCFVWGGEEKNTTKRSNHFWVRAKGPLWSPMPSFPRSDGTFLSLPPSSFPNSSAHMSCIASHSWWTGV